MEYETYQGKMMAIRHRQPTFEQLSHARTLVAETGTMTGLLSGPSDRSYRLVLAINHVRSAMYDHLPWWTQEGLYKFVCDELDAFVWLTLPAGRRDSFIEKFFEVMNSVDKLNQVNDNEH